MAISALIQSKLDDLKRELDRYPVMQKVERTVRVPKEYLVTGAVVLLFLCLITGHGAAFICNLIGFLYPTLQSFKAIESASKRDTTQWLTYWLVYSTLSIPETFQTLLSWIPFYYFAKMILLLWCFMPQTEGALFIYEKVLKGLLVKSEAKIDAVLNKQGASSSSGSGASSSSGAAAASANGYPKVD